MAVVEDPDVCGCETGGPCTIVAALIGEPADDRLKCSAKRGHQAFEHLDCPRHGPKHCGANLECGSDCARPRDHEGAHYCEGDEWGHPNSCPA